MLVFALVALSLCNHLDEEERAFFLCFICLSYVLLVLIICSPTLRCHWLVCSV